MAMYPEDIDLSNFCTVKNHMDKLKEYIEVLRTKIIEGHDNPEQLFKVELLKLTAIVLILEIE